MKRHMNEWIQSLINSDTLHALPVMTFPGLQLTGDTVKAMISDPEVQCRAMQALAERYPSVAAVTTMDLSVEAEAFGSTIRYSDDEVPTVIGQLLDGLEEAEALEIPPVGKARTGVCLEAARLAVEAITDRPVFGGLIGPYSLGGRLMDMTEIMVAMSEEPELVHTVLDKTTTFLVEYAKGYKEAGCHGIVIAEPAAGLLSPDNCHEFSSVYVKRIVDAVQDENFLVVLHNCGKTVKLVPTMLSTGAKVLHFGNAIDMADILPQIPAQVLACGNIDPAGVFKNGTPELMKERTESLLRAMKPYPNFLISSGCDIPPNTPIDQIDLFFGVLQNYND